MKTEISRYNKTTEVRTSELKFIYNSDTIRYIKGEVKKENSISRGNKKKKSACQFSKTLKIHAHLPDSHPQSGN